MSPKPTPNTEKAERGKAPEIASRPMMAPVAPDTVYGGDRFIIPRFSIFNRGDPRAEFIAMGSDKAQRKTGYGRALGSGAWSGRAKPLNKPLKLTGPSHIFISPPVRAALLRPQGVGAFLKMQFLRTVPIFVSPPLGTPLLLPEQVGAVPNDLVETHLRLGENVSVISKRLQRTATANVHAGGQAMKLAVRHQFFVGCRLQGFPLIKRV